MIYWLALSLVQGLGLASKHKLLQIFGTPERIFEEKISKYDFPRIKDDIDFKKIKDNYLKSAERIIRICERDKIEIITFESVNYPKLLKEINQAPLLLYCKGNSKILSKRCVAVVGTREPNANGENDTREISKGLAENGFVVVSGLARGVDTIAHTSTLEVKKETIAVMATGINEITPAQNISLARKIIENGGALITEHEPNKLAFAPNFVQRNRIISGLSECSIIISASEKSGALRTAEFAEQQGRKLLVAPGNRSDDKYQGSNKLLLKKNVAPALLVSGIISYINGTKEVQQLDMFYTPPPPKVFAKEIIPNPIMQFLSKNPTSVETLAEKSGIDYFEICETLLEFTAKGIVVSDNTGKYRLS